MEEAKRKANDGEKSLAITPGGPRPSDMIHEVKPGQAIDPNQKGGNIVADKLVLTPGGFRSQSLVHLIEPGHGLRLDQGVLKKLELSTNKLIDLPAASPGAVAPVGPPQQRARATGPFAVSDVAPTDDGWITYAWWDSGSTSITNFSTTWTVPQAPSTYSGQTVFLFNGIENTGTDFGILQPVLQYGPSAAGGGDYWSIASWYVTSGGQAFHTTLIPVSVGQTLVGIMSQTGQSGSQYSYASQFQGVANTSLPVQNIAPLHWANQTLEAYSINLASDYPASSSTQFTGISIATGATSPSLRWNPVNAVTDFGQHAAVVSDVNPGGQVDLYYGSGWQAFDLSLTPGAQPAVGDPMGYVFVAENRQHIVYRGVDGHHIHELAYTLGVGPWGHFDLTQTTGAPLAAGDPMGYVFVAENRQHIVYLGADSHIHELAYTLGVGPWEHFDLTQTTGAPLAAGDPMGYVFVAENRQHIVYRGVDGHIHELAYTLGVGPWGHFDLTQTTGAPLAGSNPMGYVFVAENRQHIVYRSVDGHIHELAYTLGVGPWEHFDLTQTTGAPLATGDPMGYVFVAENRQHIVYRGMDGHIHELAYTLGVGPWGHFDLTQTTGAPLAAGDPMGYVFVAENRQHIVYWGVDGHIHELAYTLGVGPWGHFDLTQFTGAPPAEGNPSGYVFDAERRQHVVYRDASGRIWELAYSLG